MTDRLGTYVPSFILAAVVEFVAAALLLILVCDKKQTQNRGLEESVDGGEHCEQRNTQV